MATIKLKKGFDLNLVGGITQNTVVAASPSETIGIVPDDFHGIIPRLDKKEGEKVLAGEAIFHDKNHEEILITSPVSGTIKEVKRGERRKIEVITITPDGTSQEVKFDTNANPKDLILKSGLWAMMRQRPYDVVPNPNETPRDIFVTCFDSAPLAPSLQIVLGDNAKYVQAGIDALSQLTEGDVYLGFKPGEEIDVKGAVVNTFSGPHPAGNVGIQIANTKPVNKGEVIWTLDIVTVARIGELVSNGKVNYNTIVAVTGSQVKEPKYVSTIIGSAIESLITDNVSGEDNRIINGNVLTGIPVSAEGFLQAPYRHLTVIPNVAKKDEFMGWANLSPNKYSIYRNFTGWLFGKRNKAHTVDARILGGERAIVMAGEYDNMLPMDILSEFLIKAIITYDIEKMEQLGIYEVAPEDFALAEYADTSKLELQRIVREGLDKLRKEMA